MATIEQAAQYLGISTRTVYRRIESGKLQASKINGEWVISDEQIEESLNKKKEKYGEIAKVREEQTVIGDWISNKAEQVYFDLYLLASRIDAHHEAFRSFTSKDKKYAKLSDEQRKVMDQYFCLENLMEYEAELSPLMEQIHTIKTMVNDMKLQQKLLFEDATELDLVDEFKKTFGLKE